MKLARFLLISIAVIVVVLAVVLGIGLSSSFQTWAVRRVLASQTDVPITVGRVVVRLHRVELYDVRATSDSVHFEAPAIKARLPVLRAWWHKRYDIARLEALGWRIEMRRTEPELRTESPSTAPGGSPLVPEAHAAAGADPGKPDGSTPPLAVAAREFKGVFDALRSPVDFSIETLELNGTITLRNSRVLAKVGVTGGMFAPGRDGKIDVQIDTSVSEGAVSTVHVDGQLTGRMDTPRTFRRLGANLKATAAGPKLASHVTLRAEASASRDERAETYTAEVNGNARRLFSFLGEYPLASRRITGTWKLDLNDADIATFMLGRQMPTFAATGEGRIDTDTSLEIVHTAARLDASVDRLGVLRPELASIGNSRLTANVDLARRGNVLKVAVLDVALATDRPVANVRSLQSFEFNFRTGELHPTDPAMELVGIVLQGLPLTWAKPFLHEYTINGGDLRGEFAAMPRSGGFSFRAKTPLTVTGLSVSRGGTALLQGLDVSLNPSGDYTPQGWQADIAAVSAKSGSRNILMLDARAGRLAGKDEPIKATGLMTADLAALAAQPVFARAFALSRGDASLEFAAKLGATHQVDARLSVKGIQVTQGETVSDLPMLSASVRADVAQNGETRVNAPITIQQGDRASDATIVALVKPGVSNPTFQAQLQSKIMVIDDARAFAALMAGEAPGQAPRANAPSPWRRIEGTLSLQLGEVIYSDKMKMTNVAGMLRFSGGAVKFENLRASVNEGANALLNGGITTDTLPRPRYSLGADLALVDFDPAPYLREVSAGPAPAIDGRFNLQSRVSAKAATLSTLPPVAQGTFELTSKVGTFRGMSVNVGNLVENSGKLASWLASAGNAITSIAGRKDENDAEEIKSRSQAASELAKSLSSIAYDQLRVVVERDESLNATVKEFNLISPEFRITGNGTIRHVPGRSIFDDIVSLDLRLRVQGRPAELMKFLGVLEGNPDDLGYVACTIPVSVSGTMASFDTSDLTNRIVALAVKKSGLTDTWISRLLGR